MITRRAFLAATGAAVLASRAVRAASSMSAAAVLVPDRPWEGSCAMPFSGGLWKVGASYRCWYLAGFQRVCLAFSDDGLHWEKPDLGVVPGTNIVLEPAGVDTACVWPVDGGGWVMSVSTPGGGPVRLLTSKDGIRWASLYTLPLAGDRTTMFFDHVADRWVYCVRAGAGTDGDPRRIDRVVSETLIPVAWEPVRWLEAEAGDGRPPAQLYAVDVVPMGDRFLGLFTIFRGVEAGRPKLNDVCIGWSDDGETFTRSHEPVLTRSTVPGAWNWGNVQSVCGGVVKDGDRYRVYASGRAGVPGTSGNGVCSMGYGLVTL